MIINTATYSISELVEQFDRHDLIVNRDYQRGTGIWPDGPSSYFIDTILEGFPFPKMYVYEYLTRPEHRTKKELVDGQQRLNTIRRFLADDLTLAQDSKFAGQKFSDLDEDDRIAFLSYPVAVDVIRNARPPEILQMFRRMNAFTLPLNEAERRHSSYQGAFKWFVNSTADDLSEFFISYGVFTAREIVRMADAEFISECVLAMERGVISTSPSDLNRIYQKYDEKFDDAEHYSNLINSSFQYLTANFDLLRKTKLMKNYALQSLVIALQFARYGNETLSKEWNIQPIGRFSSDPDRAVQGLLTLAQAHEAKELGGPYGRYVWGCMGGTNREPRRRARLCAILRILGVAVPGEVDAELPE